MYKKGHKIIYEKGDKVGPYNIEFIEESTPKSGHRYGIFICPNCQKEFTTRISKIKTGTNKSCGCQCLNQKHVIEIGKKYNKLTVLSYLGVNKHHQRIYECKCECGNIITVRANDLSSGKTKSCGCLSKKITSQRRQKKLMGKIIGYLTVIKPTTKRSHGSIVWECVCKCGNVCYKSVEDLTRCKNLSCGCMHNSRIDITNQRFGKLIALEPTNEKDNQGHILWKCQCDCGNIVYKPGFRLKAGSIKSCGCLKGKSSGEEKCKQVLQKAQIKYKTQYKFSNCKNILPLPFDFYLPDYNICIEYDGQQHFKPISIFGGEEDFKKRQRNDEIKNQYCKDNNIKLIRIPYWDYDKLNEEYLLSLIEG